ncbi:hypothetical protein DPMN_166124 [Dreissena polymorpha]|uniref:Uncharacterized protein n=1 Tax=Dreissena polymorpha TaxID=45954 RepID=A0A9D4EY99_DREPO|nr:hypothetical protein DPMN_166124 [Dreissena polymorpha]
MTLNDTIDTRSGCLVSAVVGARASDLGNPGSITVICTYELGSRSSYRTDVMSLG